MEKTKSFSRMIPLFVMITVIGISWLFGYYIYHSNSDWRKFREYNDVREKLMDYDIPTYEGNEDEYISLGLNENDYKMLATWQYADDEVFDVDTLKALLKYREEKYPRILSIHRIKEILNLVIIGAGSYHQIYVVLFLFIVCFLSTRENRVYMLLSILLLLGQLCYLRYVVRFFERSVMFPVVVTMVLIVFFYQPEYEMLTSLIITFALVVFFAYVGCGMADTDGWEDNHVNKKSEVNSIYQVLSLNENNLYVWHIFTASGNIDGGYDRFDGYAFGQHHNSVFSGGWRCHLH